MGASGTPTVLLLGKRRRPQLRDRQPARTKCAAVPAAALGHDRDRPALQPSAALVMVPAAQPPGPAPLASNRRGPSAVLMPPACPLSGSRCGATGAAHTAARYLISERAAILADRPEWRVLSYQFNRRHNADTDAQSKDDMRAFEDSVRARYAPADVPLTIVDLGPVPSCIRDTSGLARAVKFYTESAVLGAVNLPPVVASERMAEVWEDLEIPTDGTPVAVSYSPP